MSEVPYDIGRALDYIRGLGAPTSGSGMGAPSDAGIPFPTGEMIDRLRIQPDLGPVAGPLVALLAGAIRPARMLEIGTGIGTTAILLGRVAREYGGRVDTIEIRPEIAELAANAVRAAGLEGTVRVIRGDARALVEDGLELEGGRHEDVLPGSFGLILQDGGPAPAGPAGFAARAERAPRDR